MLRGIEAALEGLCGARREAVRRFVAEYSGIEYPVLTASQYMAFTRTGERAVMEAPYFLRRRKLIAALLGALMDGEGVDAVADGLWLICEETSWVISAHNGGEHDGVEARAYAPLPDPDRPYVDLFAAQTAMILSVACRLLEKPLDDVTPLIRRRVQGEVERRVLKPFETRDDFWWMGVIRKDLNNWTPWIVSSVACAACVWIEAGARLDALLNRCDQMVGRYMDCIPGDGGCDEGVGYWSMATGAVLDFVQLMETRPGWRFGQTEKLRRMARFPLDMWLGGDWFANFGDCDARPEVPGERLQYAGRRLDVPELTALGARFRGDPTDMVKDTPQLWRLVNELVSPMDGAGEIDPPAGAWLGDLEIRRLTRGGATLVCKGGVNGFNHSHNDCGSFIYFADGEPQVVDAGNAVYTRKTFSEARFGLWHIRSRYHNVPLIGDFEQAAGEDHRARDVACEVDGLSLDIAGAYPAEAGVKALRRRFSMAEDGAVTLSDEIGLDAPRTVTETLMLRRRPEITGGGVRSGAIRVGFDETMAVEVEEIPIDDPRMARNYPGSLWRVALTAPAARQHRIDIRIERARNE